MTGKYSRPAANGPANNGAAVRAERAEPSSRFTPRVITVILIILFVFLGWTFYWLLYAEQQSLFAARREVLAEQVHTALSVCRRFNAEVEEGRLRRDVGIEQARQMLAAMRYGQLSDGVFIVLDTQGTLVAHPLRTDLVGENLLELADGRGQAFVAEMIEQSRHQPGVFLTYQWRWLDGAVDVPDQLAYVALYEPWNWLIVTDKSTADINERIMSDLARQVGLLFMLTLVLAGVLSATLRRLVLHGVDRLIGVARRLAAGDLSARAAVNPMDEMNALAAATNQMAEGIQERDEQVRLTQRTAVYALAKLAEARDNETGGHLLRVREYAGVLAHALRKQPGWESLIDRQFIADLYDASLLHDVGKVAIPDSILLKPDILDEGEMAIMMSHTLVGANTIRAARKRMQARSTFLVMAEQIARSHHERWDGRGYVEGLKGDQIPPVARIFSVADVYDALTTVRPYKPAYSHEQAIEMMREERGQRFDPQVFDAFLGVAGKFNDIRIQFAD